MPQTRPSIAAVVVTHDRLDKLTVTAARLLDQPVDHVIVVDNASTDGTAAWLATLDDPRLQVHRSATNQGGAGGFSVGMRLARDVADADWTVVMDDDGRPAPGAIDAFRATDLSRWDAIGAAVHHPDGRIRADDLAASMFREKTQSLKVNIITNLECKRRNRLKSSQNMDQKELKMVKIYPFSKFIDK